MNPGDYFIYKPSYLGWEIPISANQQASPGFICFQSKSIGHIIPSIDFIYPKSNLINENVDITFRSRNEIYGKLVDNDNPNFIMDSYDIHINNKSKNLISSYSYKIEINEKMYFSNMWDMAGRNLSKW